MVSAIDAIDFSNRPTHEWRQLMHHPRIKIRLMRGFVTTNFFHLFFLVPELDAKEAESTDVK